MAAFAGVYSDRSDVQAIIRPVVMMTSRETGDSWFVEKPILADGLIVVVVIDRGFRTSVSGISGEA